MLSVVVFHAFPNSLKGGFIGVDVFFVISGYLISAIIFENLNNGTFSFLEFYARRINRIFPALILVLTASYVFGWFALLADEYKQLGKHIAASAGFVYNIVLRGEVGYFDNSAETKPLLHLWSLGIEEQFYIVWPPLLWLVWKRKFNLFTITALVTVASLYLNIKGVRKNAVGTFYSPQTRFWELLSGSLLAWTQLHKQSGFISVMAKRTGRVVSTIYRSETQLNGKLLSNGRSLLGLFILAYGFWRINKELSFPGSWAIVPVLGAVILISAGPTAWVNRVILSNRVAVWFGMISYPLYLWHWPLLSFARIVESEVPSSNIRIAALFASIILAWLTYKLVERPIRLRKHSQTKVVVLVLLMGIVGYVGYNTWERGGLEFRKSPVVTLYGGDIGVDSYFKFWTEKFFPCANAKILREALPWAGYVRCLQSKKNADVDIVLIGDSHAEQLFMGIANSMPEYNIAYYIKNDLPFISNENYANIFTEVKRSESIKKVILAALWSRRIGDLPEGVNAENELISTIDMLESSGKQVFLTDNIPMFPFSANLCAQGRKFSTNPQKCNVDKAVVMAQSMAFRVVLNEVLSKRPRVKFIGVEKYFCNAETCRMENGGVLLYRDNRHLNINGSRYLGELVVRDNWSLLTGEEVR